MRTEVVRLLVVVSLATLAACRTAPETRPPPPSAEPPPVEAPTTGAEQPTATEPPATIAAETCGNGEPLKVRFFDVGQALSALVELPDGRFILVDTGEAPNRPGCGAVCRNAHRQLLEKLDRYVGEKPLSLVWVTHQHSDHLGGATAVLDRFDVQLYVDNGRDTDRAQVSRIHDALRAKGVRYEDITPGDTALPFATSGPLKVRPIVPTEWPRGCRRNPNECSIALRIDYCDSSVLFTGDGEHEAEDAWDVGGTVTVLQAGHHGAETSTTATFVERLKPKYAVISSGKPGEGLNRTYCHPRQATIDRLNAATGGSGSRRVRCFYGSSCSATATEWRDVQLSDAVFITAVDGDVTLVTYGDGAFTRE